MVVKRATYDGLLIYWCDGRAWICSKCRHTKNSLPLEIKHSELCPVPRLLKIYHEQKIEGYLERQDTLLEEIKRLEQRLYDFQTREGSADIQWLRAYFA